MSTLKLFYFAGNNLFNPMSERIRISMIDWEYPATKEIPDPWELDLTNNASMHLLLLSFGNGTIVELYAEAEHEQALTTFRYLAEDIGACKARPLTQSEKQSLWLYREGVDAYVRDSPAGSPTYVLINPVPVKF